MISYEKLKQISLEWRQMIPAQREAVIAEVHRLRPIVAALPPFLNEALDTWREDCPGCSDFLIDFIYTPAEDGEIWAVELACSRALLDPGTRAWDDLLIFLSSVQIPDHIPPDSGAGRFLPDLLEFMSVHCFDARDTLRELAKYLRPRELDAEAVAKAARSKMATENASKRNLEARAWVVTRWAARVDKGQSKAAFARQHSMLVKHRFKVDVLPDQIAREWLPKKPKSGA